MKTNSDQRSRHLAPDPAAAQTITGVWRAVAPALGPIGTRRTKIVATLGPASTDVAVIRELVAAGMDVARLNFSHGAHAEHLARLNAVREVQEETGRPLAILADLCGPKIRVGSLADPQMVRPGERIRFGGADDASGATIPITFPALAAAVSIGDPILIDDGAVRAHVDWGSGTVVACTVEIGGLVTSGKGVNLPGTRLPIPSLTDKDLDDLAFAAAHEVDYVALSFVRSAADVVALRQRLEDLGSGARIVAKIEKAEAIDELPAIVRAADVVMVARGDLGVEVGVERVPLLQKEIIRCARSAGKTVITATQMLESMIHSPNPTRAEATDIANAILDGTSAVMLSAETASGDYPVRAVESMNLIATTAEQVQRGDCEPPLDADIETLLAFTASDLAERLNARVIAVPTTTGATVRNISRFRPGRPIVAATGSELVARQLALDWGVIPSRMGSAATVEETWGRIARELLERDLAAPGDLIVLAGRTQLPCGGATSNVVVHRLEARREET